MAHPITIFYVYAESDEVLRQQLEKHLALLRRQGAIAGWEPILAGAPWAEQTEQVFNKAELILLLVSADFLDSDVCYKQQMQRALERERQGEVKVIPILLRPVDWESAPFADLQVLPTNRKPIISWATQDTAFAQVAEGIRYVLEGKPLPSVASVSLASTSALPEKRVRMVPYARNPFFTGRDAVLDDLHQRFKQGQSQAMSGLGGIGKTQIAVEYAYRYSQEYQYMLWASAETAELLAAAYTKIATTLDLPEKGAKEQEVIVKAVKQWLQEHQQWLLILDNADEPEVLEPFLPPVVGGHVLVTTRASDVSSLGLGFGHVLEVETFTAEQGGLFLLHRAQRLALGATIDQAQIEERQQAMKLSEELGGLALALDQAGAYLLQTGRDLATYQQLYQTHRKQLLQERREKKDHPDPVATTWKLSFERVEAANEAAAELLRLCSFLASDAIPEWMLTKGATQVGPLLAPVVTDAYLLDQAVEALRAYSLLRRDAQTGMLSLHRLVQVVLRDAMTEEEETAWKQKVLLFLLVVCPDARKVEQWQKCEQWIPHALVSATWLEQAVMRTEPAAFVCNAAGYYLRERGWYAVTEPLYKRTLAIYEHVLGPGHPDTATSLNNLAELYQEQGKYALAEPLIKRALAIYEQELGPTHPLVATSLNNLALFYSVQGNHGEAEPLLRRALKTWEQSVGVEHPNTKQGRKNYAVVLRKLGREEEAAALEVEGK